MTEATTKRGRGRPRKLPADSATTVAPAQAEPVVAGLSAALAPPEPAPAATPEAAQREEMRADPQTEMRAEDPRAEAERIAREWFGHLDSLGPHKDKYYVDPSKIPDGWSYEWRTYTVVGKENPQYQVQLQRGAWRPVMANRHPELMPKGYEGAVLIDGMMLMERPKAITDFQKERDRRDANAPIENIRAKLAGTPQGQFPRGGPAPLAVNTAFAAPDIPAAKA